MRSLTIPSFSGLKRPGVAVPSDSSMPFGRAGVLTGSVRVELGVVGTGLALSKSTSSVRSHWPVLSTGLSKVEVGKSDTRRSREVVDESK